MVLTWISSLYSSSHPLLSYSHLCPVPLYTLTMAILCYTVYLPAGPVSLPHYIYTISLCHYLWQSLDFLFAYNLPYLPYTGPWTRTALHLSVAPGAPLRARFWRTSMPHLAFILLLGSCGCAFPCRCCCFGSGIFPITYQSSSTRCL